MVPAEFTFQDRVLRTEWRSKTALPTCQLGISFGGLAKPAEACEQSATIRLCADVFHREGKTGQFWGSGSNGPLIFGLFVA